MIVENQLFSTAKTSNFSVASSFEPAAPRTEPGLQLKYAQRADARTTVGSNQVADKRLINKEFH